MPEDFDFPGPKILAEPVQPEAAIAFWAWKSTTPYSEVKKLADGARERAFYVTGLAERDAVQSVKDALAKALKNGETFADFQGRIGDVIQSQGWRGDRIETIFRNNLQTAYSAGRYAKMQAVKKARPYWQYVTVGDERVRPSHAILSGKVYPADHEFWGDNYPPNGHKCRCTVITLSARQVEKDGLTVEKDMPGDGMSTDPKTGMEYHVARPGADDGWRNNPGKAWVESGGSAPANPSAGLPLERHPDLTPEAYAEQRLRPKPVNNFGELADGIKDRCGGFLRNSNGFTQIREVRETSFMATNCRGALTITNRAIQTTKGAYNPAKELQAAWNNLATGKPLNWLEEYSVEGLWHEITHNRQKWGYLGKGDTAKRRVMEIVTQWTARRTYPEFLQSLGGKAAHLATVKSEGLGYGGYIKNFDKLLSVLKIDEDALLKEMNRLIDTETFDTYRPLLADWLSKQSGHKKGAISNALSDTDMYREQFEGRLQQLGLLPSQEG